MPFLTQGKTNWKFLLIVIILAAIVDVGILAYTSYFIKEKISITPTPPLITKKSEEVTPKEKYEEIIKDEEITNSSLFSIEDYGFSMKIPTSYTKKEETEKSGLKRIVFSTEKDKKTIVLVIDQSKYAEAMRSTLLSMLKVAPEEYIKISEESLPNVTFIFSKNINKGTCVGKWDYYKENNETYVNSLNITSLNIKNMDLMISFNYYNKDNELPISKVIETINCSK
jgi:hypothetical protein